MEKTQTYRIIIKNEEWAFSDLTEELLGNIFENISTDDYFVSILPTPLLTTKYSASITILKKSLEEALPVYNEICKCLDNRKITFVKSTTELLWGDDVPKLFVEI